MIDHKFYINGLKASIWYFWHEFQQFGLDRVSIVSRGLSLDEYFSNIDNKDFMRYLYSCIHKYIHIYAHIYIFMEIGFQDYITKTLSENV